MADKINKYPKKEVKEMPAAAVEQAIKAYVPKLAAEELKDAEHALKFVQDAMKNFESAAEILGSLDPDVWSDYHKQCLSRTGGTNAIVDGVATRIKKIREGGVQAASRKAQKMEKAKTLIADLSPEQLAELLKELTAKK